MFSLHELSKLLIAAQSPGQLPPGDPDVHALQTRKMLIPAGGAALRPSPGVVRLVERLVERSCAV
jgi:hypothetical protein